MNIDDFSHNFDLFEKYLHFKKDVAKNPRSKDKSAIYRRKRDEYQKAHDDTITKMNVIAALLPEWCFNVGTELTVEEPENIQKDADELMGSDMLNFMLHTYNFRRERDAKKATEDYRCRILPESYKETQPDSNLEEFFSSYSISSGAKDIPFWPLLPLNKDF